MPRKKYRMVGLPEDLYLEVEKIVEAGRYGYTSISEFVKDAVRRRLEEITRNSEDQ
ncbi:MAG: ribbon-helix-helix domain-containing protein [Candidatus Bathyarchaeia archaeon]